MKLHTENYKYNPNNPKGLVIFIHGYGSNGNDLLSLSGLFASILKDYAFISPNAPFIWDGAETGNQSHAYQWFTISNNFLALSNDFLKAAKILEEYIIEQTNIYNTNNIILIGFSQGGMLAGYSALVMNANLNIQCAISFSGAMPFFMDLKNKIKRKCPICLIHGTQDQSVLTHNFSEKAKQDLDALDVTNELHIIKGMRHEINDVALSIGINFVKKI